MLSCDIRIFRLIEEEDGMECLHDNDDNTWLDNFIISFFLFSFFFDTRQIGCLVNIHERIN